MVINLVPVLSPFSRDEITDNGLDQIRTPGLKILERAKLLEESTKDS